MPSLGFQVYEVDSCPVTNISRFQASEQLKCDLDTEQSSNYHCAPNEEKSSLLEFCYTKSATNIPEGKCIMNSVFIKKKKNN